MLPFNMRTDSVLVFDIVGMVGWQYRALCLVFWRQLVNHKVRTELLQIYLYGRAAAAADHTADHYRHSGAYVLVNCSSTTTSSSVIALFGIEPLRMPLFLLFQVFLYFFAGFLYWIMLISYIKLTNIKRYFSYFNLKGSGISDWCSIVIDPDPISEWTKNTGEQ